MEYLIIGFFFTIGSTIALFSLYALAVAIEAAQCTDTKPYWMKYLYKMELFPWSTYYRKDLD